MNSAVPASLVPYSKIPIPVAQQVALLASRGMTIEDPAFAEGILSRVNYYRLSAYSRSFRIDGSDRFKPGASFARVVELYEIDRRLRLALMDAIERVEVAVRTTITSTYSARYGTFGHVSPKNFDPRFAHAEWSQKLAKEVEDSTEVFIAHYRKTYQEYPQVPLWMGTELLSFGALTRFFKGWRSDLRTQVASRFGCHEEVFSSWLLSLSYVRNLCAHHSRLLHRDLAVKPKLPAKNPSWAAPELALPGRIFVAILVIRSMLRTFKLGTDWAQRFELEFRADFADPLVLYAIGAAGDWTAHPIWKGPPSTSVAAPNPALESPLRSQGSDKSE